MRSVDVQLKLAACIWTPPRHTCVEMLLGLRSRTTTCVWRRSAPESVEASAARSSMHESLSAVRQCASSCKLAPLTYRATPTLPLHSPQPYLFLVIGLHVGVGGLRATRGDGLGQHTNDLRATAARGAHQKDAVTDCQQLAAGGRAEAGVSWMWAVLNYNGVMLRREQLPLAIKQPACPADPLPKQSARAR